MEDPTPVYLFLSPHRKKCYQPVLSLEEMSSFLRKDNVLSEMTQKTCWKWKGFILDTKYSISSFPIKETRDLSKWIFYSLQVLSMMYSHLYRLIQEDNLSFVTRSHKSFTLLDNKPQQIRIGVLWYRHRGWFVAENELTKEIHLIW